jgi:GT2 family glycosyltransferase
MDLVILLLNWNSQEQTIRCLKQLDAMEASASARVLVLDNGSTRDEASTIRQTALSHLDLQVIRSDRNLGFAGGVNRGWRYLQSTRPPEVLVLLNCDIDAPANLLSSIWSAFEAIPDLDALGVTIDQNGRRFQSCEISPVTGNIVHREKAKFFSQSLGVMETRWIHGCCFALRASLMDQVGPWDESFFAYHEEGDYCLRALSAGARLGVLTQVRIKHFGKGTSGHLPNLSRYLLLRNKLLLIRKHRSYFKAYFKADFHAPVALAHAVFLYAGKLMLSARDFESLAAAAKALRDGVFGRGGPPPNA